MSITKTLFLAGTLALSAYAAPLPACDAPAATSAASTTSALTAEQLVKIDPRTASCSGAPFPKECKDATAAATALNKAFAKYNITSTEEQAAIIAYELFESGGFKYDENHFPAPGNPAQGTRMMASPTFVKEYATVVNGADAVAQAGSGPAILALVNADDETSFGSAPWFVTVKCSPEVRTGLQAGTVDGWHSFLTGCINTSLDGRDDLWIAAKQIMLGH